MRSELSWCCCYKAGHIARAHTNVTFYNVIVCLDSMKRLVAAANVNTSLTQGRNGPWNKRVVNLACLTFVDCVERHQRLFDCKVLEVNADSC